MTKQSQCALYSQYLAREKVTQPHPGRPAHSAYAAKRRRAQVRLRLRITRTLSTRFHYCSASREPTGSAAGQGPAHAPLHVGAILMLSCTGNMKWVAQGSLPEQGTSQRWLTRLQGNPERASCALCWLRASGPSWPQPTDTYFTPVRVPHRPPQCYCKSLPATLCTADARPAPPGVWPPAEPTVLAISQGLSYMVRRLAEQICRASRA